MAAEADPRVARLMAGAAALGVAVSPAAAGRLLTYLDLVYQANQEFNLTRVDPSEAVEKHVLDSLAGLRAMGSLEPAARVVDVGTGAGFPGVVLACARPGWRVTLVEAARKKSAFVERAAAAAGIGNVEAVWGRAETLAQAAYREQFDAAVARALAPLPVLLELTLPFVRPGGLLAAYKGEDAAAELAAAADALRLLGGSVEGVDRFRLPWSDSPRSIVTIRKVRATPPGYPRRPGVPARRPLGG